MKLILSLLLMCLSTSVPTLLADDERPNILVIVSDDQGYANAGFQDGKDVPTPHLD